MPICDPCKRGGQLLVSLKATSDAISRVNLGEKSRGQHELCPGKDHCDCQHFVGQAIRKEYR